MENKAGSVAQKLQQFVAQVRGRLIVSCQAQPHEPLYGSAIMARMAVAAAQGGAAAIRANTPQDIAAIRGAVSLPIVGLYKVDLPGYEVYITPRLVDARRRGRGGGRCDRHRCNPTASP